MSSEEERFCQLQRVFAPTVERPLYVEKHLLSAIVNHDSQVEVETKLPLSLIDGLRVEVTLPALPRGVVWRTDVQERFIESFDLICNGALVDRISGPMNAALGTLLGKWPTQQAERYVASSEVRRCVYSSQPMHMVLPLFTTMAWQEGPFDARTIYTGTRIKITFAPLASLIVSETSRPLEAKVELYASLIDEGLSFDRSSKETPTRNMVCDVQKLSDRAEQIIPLITRGQVSLVLLVFTLDQPLDASTHPFESIQLRLGVGDTQLVYKTIKAEYAHELAWLECGGKAPSAHQKFYLIPLSNKALVRDNGLPKLSKFANCDLRIVGNQWTEGATLHIGSLQANCVIYTDGMWGMRYL